MPDELLDIPRARYIGRRVGGEPEDEREHYIKCPDCGAWLDMRDLGQILAHDRKPLPHPVEDRGQ